MRKAWMVPVMLFGGAMLLPVAEPKALPLEGIKLVAEERVAPAELVAYGKNGSGGNKNGTGKKGGDGPSTFSSYFSYFGRRDLPGSADLVATELR